MKNYYQLEPEVSGELGQKTVLDSTIHPPKIEKLEFLFKGWLGDCLVACFPVFLIKEETLKILIDNNQTGLSTRLADIKTDYPFDELNPNVVMPKFIWIEINGIAKKTILGLRTTYSCKSRFIDNTKK